VIAPDLLYRAAPKHVSMLARKSEDIKPLRNMARSKTKTHSTESISNPSTPQPEPNGMNPYGKLLSHATTLKPMMRRSLCFAMTSAMSLEPKDMDIG